MIWTTVIFLITICILVTVHEFGHFIVARLCGVKVLCFSIGFGKKLFSYTSRAGTIFTLSIIPLGGYVKMLDSRSNNELSNDEKNIAFDHKSIIQRAAIISAGPIANFLLAIIIYWIIFLVGVATYPVKVAQTIPNTPAASVNIPQGAELKSIAGIKVESWADISSALLSEMGNNSIELTYETDDGHQYNELVSIKNWRFDIEKTSPITAFGLTPAAIEVYPIISQIVANSAADKAGLQVGDKIESYNNQHYDNWDNFAALIRTGAPIKLDIARDNQIISLTLIPQMEVNRQGEKIGVVGIYPSNNTIVKQYGIVSSVIKSIDQTGLTIKLVARSFYQLVTGVISIQNLSGPVTIAKGAGQTASYGFMPYLYFLAFISVSLGVINLVPLPMLDGGHLFFLLVEKIKGAPLSDAVQAALYRLGFVLLMIIMGIALFNDFIRL